MQNQEPSSESRKEDARQLLGRRPISKKQAIRQVFMSGEKDILKIAGLVQCRPSYVAQALQQEGLIRGYFDLYTSTKVPQNVYSPFFKDVLSFKDVEASRQSITHIDALYRYFESVQDRAGQHHAMMLALTGQNRARWSGKQAEASIFHEWLVNH